MYDRYGRRMDGPGNVETAFDEGDSLGSPAALHALVYMTRSHALVDTVVNRYKDWNTLAHASTLDLAHTMGPWAAQLKIPATCPELPFLGDGVVADSRYGKEYPKALTELSDAPALIYRLGTVPTVPMLAVGGTHFPSASALEVTRRAVRAAVKLGIPVIAALDTGCGHIAVEESVERHGTVVAVASGDLSRPASNAVLMRRVLDNGGAVVSAWGPGEVWSEARTFEASRIAAAMSTAVVIPELGSHPAGGVHLARTAVMCNRYIIVPEIPGDAELTVGADGVSHFSRSRGFAENVYGSNQKVLARVRAGYPAADSVVASREEMQDVIKFACSVPE